MKRTTILLALLIGALSMSAQTETKTQDTQMNTLFGNHEKPKLGWVIGFQSGYTKFNSRDVNLSEFFGGLVIDHNFTLSFAGKGWNRNNLYFENIKDTIGGYMEGGYGGLQLEYTLFPASMVHVTFPVLIGAGGISYHRDDDYERHEYHDGKKDHGSLATGGFFVIEPGVYAEVNIFKFMRLDAGVTYRYVPNLKVINTSSDMLNNFNASIGLKFGKF